MISPLPKSDFSGERLSKQNQHKYSQPVSFREIIMHHCEFPSHFSFVSKSNVSRLLYGGNSGKSLINNSDEGIRHLKVFWRSVGIAGN